MKRHYSNESPIFTFIGLALQLCIIVPIYSLPVMFALWVMG